MTWSVGAGLEGKGVIVTGAAGGIGRAVTEAFATTGARVMAVDVDQAKVDEVVAGLEGTGHVGVAADLRDLAGHDALIARARSELGNLYVLANLAAVLRRRGSLDEVTEDDWDFQHDINLKAAFFLARAAGRAMIEGGQGGRIILFSSQGWWTGGFGGSVAYAATKGGVTSMCRGLARTFGAHQITVNCVSPGQVHTPMLMTGLAPEVYEAMKKQTPLGYVAEPVEMAGPVVFLASDHAKYITGSHDQCLRRLPDVLMAPEVTPFTFPWSAGYHYSQSVAEGDLVVASGQGGFRADGSLPEGFEAQFRQALANLDEVLQAQGASLESVLRLTTYLADAADYAAFKAVREEVLRPPYPASTAVVVGFVFPGMLVEVEAIASRRGDRVAAPEGSADAR